MSDILSILKERRAAFDFFSEVYLFGSSLLVTNPADIDLLLVYEGVAERHIEDKKSEIVDLMISSTGIECHFVTLSRNEIEQSHFLGYVVHKKVK